MTIFDVAEKAGVSVATVSRVVNGRSTVAPKTARKVRDVMKELGYEPGIIRRGPKPMPNEPKGSDVLTVGVLLLGRTMELLQAPSMSRMLGGILEVGRAHEVDTLIMEMPDPSVVPTRVRDGGIDGLLVTGQQARREWADLFHPVPIVSPGGLPMDVPSFDQVVTNERAIATLAVDYLRGRGCRTLACANHDCKHATFGPRMALFEEFAAKSGSAARHYELPDRANLQEADMWQASRLREDFSVLLDLMLADGELPDGVFLPTDQQAAVFHGHLRERGLEGRVTTVSCNNEDPWLSMIHPRPATIALRVEDRGRLAMGRLLQRILNPAMEPTVTLVTPRLVPGAEE